MDRQEAVKQVGSRESFPDRITFKYEKDNMEVDFHKPKEIGQDGIIFCSETDDGIQMVMLASKKMMYQVGLELLTKAMEGLDNPHEVLKSMGYENPEPQA